MTMEDRRFGVQNNQAAYDTTGERSQVTAGISDDAMKVLRNTYMLLGMTLAFSALTAFLNMNSTHPGFLITIVGYIGLLFATYKLKNSPWGIVTTFALTGFMGYTLGPIIGAFVAAGASQIVAQALTLTAVAFVGLSATAIITKKDFSFMSSFLTAGAFVLIGAMLLAFFMESSDLHLSVYVGFTIFASIMILFETSQIIKDGQCNYIIATSALYITIYNPFVSLLHLLPAFSCDDWPPARQLLPETPVFGGVSALGTLHNPQYSSPGAGSHDADAIELYPRNHRSSLVVPGTPERPGLCPGTGYRRSPG